MLAFAISFTLTPIFKKSGHCCDFFCVLIHNAVASVVRVLLILAPSLFYMVLCSFIIMITIIIIIIIHSIMWCGMVHGVSASGGRGHMLQH
jgi:hypothetical protein